MFSISVELLPTSELTNEQIEIYWQLYRQGYDVSHERFRERWQALDQVAIFRVRKTSEIIGFIGIRYRDIQLNKSRFKTLYWGQGYILPAYRAKKLIQRLQIKLFLQSKSGNPFNTLYFWTDALSYKPYLAMANYLCDYYPNPFKTTPKIEQALLNCLGETYYADAWDPATGTVHKPSRQVTENSSIIVDKDLENPYIRFYLERNPNYIRGHGLLLMCPLSIKNCLFFFYRVIQRTIKGSHVTNRKVKSL